jgi:hydrogenase nickel incorporation protein HypA/HybF
VHELAVTQSILEIALRYAGDACRITHLYLVIGDLAGIVDDSVQFYWDIITKDTIAEGSELHFQRIKTVFHCNSCGHDFSPDGRLSECPHCGGYQVIITAGREFRLESIEVEQNDKSPSC